MGRCYQIGRVLLPVSALVTAVVLGIVADQFPKPTLIGVLGILLFLELVAIVTTRQMQRSTQRAPLRCAAQPFLNHNDQTVLFRMEGTAKDASEGFNRCQLCGFENFKRMQFCSICGEQIVVDRNKTTNKHLAHRPHRPAAPTLTTRHKRAMKRREWTRKVDVEGRPYWYRDALAKGIQSNTTIPGWTVVLECKQPDQNGTSSEKLIPMVDNDHQTQTIKTVVSRLDDLDDKDQSSTEDSCINDSDSNSHSHETDSVESRPDEQRALRKRKRYQHQDPDWINSISSSSLLCHVNEARNAEASQFPTGQMIHPNKYKEMMDMAAMDFPSRYSHFVAHASSSMCPTKEKYLKFKVHRDFIFEESMGHLACIDPKHIRSVIRIKFMGESGVDAGGVHREWFMLLNDRLVDKRFGLFRCSNMRDQSYYLNPNSEEENGEDHLVYYYGIGRLVGRALLEGSVLSFHLAVPLLKLMLGTPVTFDDLEYLDKETYRGLMWLLKNENVEDLGLTFSVCESIVDPQGQRRVKVVDLIPNGREIDVTDANKREFVQRKFEYLVFTSVSRQLHAFLRGVYEVVPLELLMLFDHEELDYILCGDDQIDVEDWERHTHVSQRMKRTMTLRWFWEVVREMPMEYRSRLLQFATGSSRLPASGFKGLTSYDGRLCPFSLHATWDSVSPSQAQYIRGRACFNRIDLPYFKKKRDLETMMYAILETENYGFTQD